MTLLSDCADSIEGWLLHSGIQLPEGGVGGWLDDAGSVDFVYPEVTGYYLTWLDFLEVSGQRFARQNLRNRIKARNWITRAFSAAALPRTRIYLQDATRDWRNACAFTFDLAMVWRGLSGSAGRSAGARRALERLIDEIRCMMRGSGLAAFRIVTSGTHKIPRRWSTRSGPCQTKVAAVFLVAPCRLPEDLRRAAVQVYARWRRHFYKRPLKVDRHALFYHLEGLLIAGEGFDADAPAIAARVYSRFLRTILPRLLNGHGPSTRSDILAQALRIGAAVHPALGSDGAQQLQSLADAIMRYVTPDGGVLLQLPGPRSVHRLSAWSAMFAHQALRFLDRVHNEGSIPGSWLLRLV